jgi:hypothetical protein
MLSECERVACLNRRLHFHDVPSRLTPEHLGETFRCELTGMVTSPADAPGGSVSPSVGGSRGGSS